MISNYKLPLKEHYLKFIPYVIIVTWSAFHISLGYYSDIPYRNDDAFYLLCARNFLQGLGYENVALPYRDSMLLVPSAFPLFLIIYWFCIHPFVFILKLILMMFLISGACINYFWMKNLTSSVPALCGALAFSAMPMFIMIGNGVLTESLFVPMVYMGLVAMWLREKYGNDQWWWFALICFIICARLRTIGLCFFITFSLEILFRKQWTKVFVGGTMMGIWLLFEKMMVISVAIPKTYMTGIQRSYPNVSEFSTFIHSVFSQYAHNIWAFSGTIYANSIFPWFYNLVTMNSLKRLVTMSLCVYGIYGLWVVWKKAPWTRSFLLGMALAMVPILGWPRTGTIYRYIFPFIPVFMAGLVLPLWTCKPLKRHRHWAGAVFMILITINQSIRTLQTEHFDGHMTDGATVTAVHEFVNKQPFKPDIIISDYYFYTYLKTDIKCLRPPLKTEACEPLVLADNVWFITGKPDDALSRLNWPCSLYTVPNKLSPLFTRHNWGVYKLGY